MIYVRECRRQERVAMVTGQAVRTAKRSKFELSLVRINMTDVALVGLSSGIRQPETSKFWLLLSESGMALAARELIVWGIQRETSTGVQVSIECGLRTNKCFVNSRVTMLT
jgi:hypothetical protein